MMRKLAVMLAMAVVVVAALTSTAAARGPLPVHVEATGMTYGTSGTSFAIQQHTGMGEADIVKCEFHFEAVIDEDGYFHISDVLFESALPPCNTATICPNVEWHGQVFKEEHSGQRKFNWSVCYSPFGTPFDMTCDISSSQISCDDVPIEGTGGAVEADGSISLSSSIEIEEA